MHKPLRITFWYHNQMKVNISMCIVHLSHSSYMQLLDNGIPQVDEILGVSLLPCCLCSKRLVYSIKGLHSLACLATEIP